MSLLVVHIPLVFTVALSVNVFKSDAASFYKNSGWYPHAAVAADAPVCSSAGTSILKKNGNAVDAAVATQICQGYYFSNTF